MRAPVDSPERLSQRPFRTAVLYTSARYGSAFLRSVGATEASKPALKTAQADEAVSVLICLPILADRGRAGSAKCCYDNASCISTFVVSNYKLSGYNHEIQVPLSEHIWLITSTDLSFPFRAIA